MPGGVDNIIKYCTEAGLSSIELMSGDVEDFLGAPKNPMSGMFGPPAGAQRPAGAPAGAPPAGGPPAGQQAAGARAQAGAQGAPAGAPGQGMPRRPQLTDEQKAQVAKFNSELKSWRLSLPMSRFEELRKEI